MSSPVPLVRPSLPLATRFLLVSLLLVLPFAVTVAFVVLGFRDSIGFNTAEVSGARLARPVFAALVATGGDGAAVGPRVEALREGVASDHGLTRLTAEVTGPALQAADEWATADPGPSKNLALGRLRTALQTLLVQISDYSNLTLDPDLDSYYLMDVTMFKVPEALNRWYSADESLAAGLPADRELLLLSEVSNPGISGSVGSAVREDSHFGAVDPDLSSGVEPLLAAYLSQANGVLLNPAGGGGQPAIDALVALWERSNLVLERLCQARVDRYTGSLAATVTASLLSACLAFFLLFLVLRGTVRDLGRLSLVMERLSFRDLSARLPPRGSREMVDIARRFNEVNGGLSVDVARIRDASGVLVTQAQGARTSAAGLQSSFAILSGAFRQIDQRVGEFRDALGQVGTRAADQRAAAERSHGSLETAALVLRTLGEEVSSRAREADQRAEAARAGSEGLRDSLEQISGLSVTIRGFRDAVAQVSDEASQLDDVLVRITDIADRTGILALNAAIEAAHAGKAGAGFAVVADAVRGLSASTREAVEHSAQLLDALRHKVAGGLAQAEQGAATAAEAERKVLGAGTSLDELLEGYNRTRQALVEARESLDSVMPSVQGVLAEAGGLISASDQVDLAVRSQAGALSQVHAQIHDAVQSLETSRGATEDLGRMSGILDGESGKLNQFIAAFRLE